MRDIIDTPASLAGHGGQMGWVHASADEFCRIFAGQSSARLCETLQIATGVPQSLVSRNN